MAHTVRPALPDPEPVPVVTTLPWNSTRIARLAGTALLGAWGYAIYHDPGQSVTHNIVLPIHETGHIVFMAFGELLYAAGGSIFQVLFPAIFVGYFLRRGERFAATIPLWFVGVSAIDLVPYIKDAPFGELALIGGEHDWSFVLSELAQVHNSERVGNAVLHFGGFCLLAAFGLGLYWHARPAEAR
jgi:hypothetical protein